MSRVTRRLQSRGYEMDARSRVSPAALARYMEHARWEAIHEGAFGLGYMFSRGLKIVVRAQDLTLDEPLGAGTDVDVTIALAHVGNTSLSFVHEVVRAEDGVRLAASTVVAVALDPQQGATRVPDVLREGVESVELATPLDFSGDMPDDAVVRRVGVRPSDLDVLQHVNQARYVDFVDDACALAARAGDYGDASERAGRYPRRIAIDYQRETRVGSDLATHTWAVDAQRGVFGVVLLDADCGERVAQARIVT